MVEYCYDAVRVNVPAVISAYIFDDEQPITEGCYLRIYDEDYVLFDIEGVYDSEAGCWDFHLTPELLLGFKGRYYYCIYHQLEPKTFKQPLYIL